MTTLLPWNFFIAVNDYWNYKFRDTVTNSSNQTMMQKEFTSYLAISSNIPNAVFVILNVVYGQRFRLNVRLLGSLTLMATLFIAVLIMTRMDTDTWQHMHPFASGHTRGVVDTIKCSGLVSSIAVALLLRPSHEAMRVGIRTLLRETVPS